MYIGLPLNKFIQFSQFSFQDYLSGGSLNREYFNRSKNCTTPRFICFPDPDRSGWGVEEGGGEVGGVANGLRRIAAGVCVQTLMCKYGGTTM